MKIESEKYEEPLVLFLKVTESQKKAKRGTGPSARLRFVGDVQLRSK